MLTAAQCRTVAYRVETRNGADETVCPDCIDPEQEKHTELIQYSAEELAEDDGLFCDRCSNEIIAPTPRCEECEELQDDCTCDDEDEEEEEDTEDDTDDEEDGPPAIALPCPMCGGPGGLLGTLGDLRHYRCGSCGIDFSRPRE